MRALAWLLGSFIAYLLLVGKLGQAVAFATTSQQSKTANTTSSGLFPGDTNNPQQQSFLQSVFGSGANDAFNSWLKKFSKSGT